MNRADARKFARPLWKRLGEKDPGSYAQFEQLTRKLGPPLMEALEACARAAHEAGLPVAQRVDGSARTLGGTFLKLAKVALAARPVGDVYDPAVVEAAAATFLEQANAPAPPRLDPAQADAFDLAAGTFRRPAGPTA